MSILTQQQALAVANQIRTETRLRGNTVARVGGFLGDLVDTIFSLSSGGSGPVTVPGIVGDGSTDDSIVLQAFLKAAPLTTAEVLVSAPPGGSIYLANSVTVYSSFTSLRFLSPQICGPNARVRLRGEDAEVPASNKPHFYQNVSAGDPVLYLNTDSDNVYFNVGDVVTLRGQRDATGNLLDDQKESLIVSAKDFATVPGSSPAVSKWRLTFQTPIKFSYQAHYSPSGSNPGNYSEVTKLTTTPLAVQANRGETWVRVADATMGGALAVGDLVRLQDNQTTSDAYHSAPTDYVNREVATVMEIDTTLGANQIRLSHALYHTYSLSNSPRVVLVDAVVGSEIHDVDMTWNAMGVTNALEMTNCVDCHIYDAEIAGAASGANRYSWQKQACRIQDSLDCSVQRVNPRDPALSTSGNGYGITFYGSTHCTAIDCHPRSCRHSFLLFLGATGNLVSNCTSSDCRISDYDAHGGNSFDNTFSNCLAVGGLSTPTDDPTPTKAAFRIGNPTHPLGDHYTTFINCKAVNYPGAFVEVMSPSTNTKIIKCEPESCQVFIRVKANTKTYTQDLLGNPLVGPAQEVYAGNLTQKTLVEGCNVYDCAALTDVDGNTTQNSNKIIRGLVFSNNRFYRCSDGLSARNGQDAKFSRNEFVDCASLANLYAIIVQNFDDGAGGKGVEVTNNSWRSAPRGLKATSCPALYANGNDSSYVSDAGKVFEDAGGNNNYRLLGTVVEGIAPTYLTSNGGSTGGVISSGQISKTSYDGSLSLPFTSTNLFTLGTSAPDATQGDQLLSASFKARTPGSTVRVLAWLPEISCTTADDYTLAIYVDGVFVGFANVRVSTTGAGNGIEVIARAKFTSTGSTQTIAIRGGPHTTLNNTVIQAHGGAASQPHMELEEAW